MPRGERLPFTSAVGGEGDLSLNRWSEGFQFVFDQAIVFSFGGAGGFLPNAPPWLAISSSTGKRVGRLRHPPPGRQQTFGAAFP